MDRPPTKEVGPFCFFRTARNDEPHGKLRLEKAYKSNLKKRVELSRGVPMITALECRRQSVVYMDEAKAEDDTSIRTALLALNRSLTAAANQLERLAQLREGRNPAA